MGIATGFTAERMLEIENNSVVGGEVDAFGRLVLTRHNGDSFIAGDVEGPVGPAGPIVTGVITMYGGSTPPANAVNCNGQALSRTEYSDLFAVIGTTYGSGDGSTTFNVPDFSGRGPMGFTGSGNFSVYGQTGGTEEETLSVAQMPIHTHVQNAHTHVQDSHTHTQQAHTHAFSATTSSDSHNHSVSGTTASSDVSAQWINSPASTNPDSSSVIYRGAGSSAPVRTIRDSTHTHSFSATTSSDSHTHTVSGTTSSVVPTIWSATATNQNATATNQNAGGGEAHNNLSPYLVVNFIIFT